MSYKPSYQGELIEAPGADQVPRFEALEFEEIPDSPLNGSNVVPAPEAAPEVVTPAPVPFEFLDLDEVSPAATDDSPNGDDASLVLPEDEPRESSVLPDAFMELPEANDVPPVLAEESSALNVDRTNDHNATPELVTEPVGKPIVAPQVSIPVSRPSLAVRGVKEAQKSPQVVAMPQAINSWTVASGVLKMIIMHPGYTSSLEDKLAGIEVTRHALDRVAEKVADNLGLPKTDGSRQKVKRHMLPVLESVWGYLFSNGAPNMDVDQVVDFASKFLGDAADLLSADPDELFLRSDRNLDMALARLTAMTRIQCELQPIFDVIEKYTQKNGAIGRIFFGDMTRREVLDDVFRLVEARAAAFLDGVDLKTAGDRDVAIVNRVVLRQSVDLMSGILRSEAAMARLSSFAKESPGKEGLLKDWLVSQYDEWTEGMPSLASMVSLHLNGQESTEARKGPVL